MPRSIFEQTLFETIVVRKNLTNANLSLDEGKIEKKREREKKSIRKRMICIYIYIKKKRKTKDIRHDHFNTQTI